MNSLIYQDAQNIHPNISYAGNFSDAFRSANAFLSDHDLLVVIGSFYLVGQPLKRLIIY